MFWNSDAWREMERIRRELDQLVSNNNRAPVSCTYPLINAYEDNDAVVVTAELPGATGEKVSITYSDGMLTIAGKVDLPERVNKMTAVRQERTVGAFEKTLRIPTKIDQEHIGASFTNGLLTVTLPKAEEARPKTITIETK